jgi:hypothetical protein
MASAEAWSMVRKLRDKFLFSKREPTDEDWAELIDEAFEASLDFDWEEENAEVSQG